MTIEVTGPDGAVHEFQGVTCFSTAISSANGSRRKGD
jgi:hypothetical protein